jgi:hypothetical protein
VAVIEQLASDVEPIDPSFGPHDPRVFEEGEVPSSPVVTRRPSTIIAAKRPRWLIPATAVAIAGGIAIGVYVAGRNPEPSAVPPPPHVDVAPPQRASEPPPVATDPVPAPVVEGSASPAVAPSVTGSTKPKPKKHGHHQTSPVAAGSGSGSPVVTLPSSETGSAAPRTGSAAQRPTVEWKPTMLMPTDSGSNKQRP